MSGYSSVMEGPKAARRRQLANLYQVCTPSSVNEAQTQQYQRTTDALAAAMPSNRKAPLHCPQGASERSIPLRTLDRLSRI